MKREEAAWKIIEELGKREIFASEWDIVLHLIAIAKAGGRVQFSCGACKGSGMIRTEFPRERCKDCSGSGWVTVE